MGCACFNLLFSAAGYVGQYRTQIDSFSHVSGVRMWWYGRSPERYLRGPSSDLLSRSRLCPQAPVPTYSYIFWGKCQTASRVSYTRLFNSLENACKRLGGPPKSCIPPWSSRPFSGLSLNFYKAFSKVLQGVLLHRWDLVVHHLNMTAFIIVQGGI